MAVLAVVLAAGAASAASGPDARAYERAREKFYQLKASATALRLRQSWLEVARAFEEVADAYPQGAFADRALYSAAELRADLRLRSGLAEDARAAVALYQRLLDQHPTSRFADDAALNGARLQNRVLGEGAAALRLVRKGLAAAPGDKASALAALEGELSASTEGAARAEVRQPVSEPRARAVSEAPARGRSRRAPALRPVTGEVTLAEQLGLKVKRVVIDPGHGGRDAGAVGRAGTKEKDVALQLAKRLERRLEREGFTVVLTRETDRYLSLEERSEIANEVGGDLFLSLHCNAADDRELRGVETYSLNVASDRFAARLSARENREARATVSHLEALLAEVTTRSNTTESERLAGQVQRALVSRLGERYTDVIDLGHKQALFYVLLNARMPAILVETSFLSNSTEERRLSQSQYQEDIAVAIAQGVRAFIDGRQGLASRGR